MLDLVERSVATIYAIGLYDSEDPDRDPVILREIAKISGGEAYFPDHPSDMVPVCRRIAKDIRTRYTIGYIPREEDGKSSLRRIRVRVTKRDHASSVCALAAAIAMTNVRTRATGKF